jgi:hypothetical protein
MLIVNSSRGIPYRALKQSLSARPRKEQRRDAVCQRFVNSRVRRGWSISQARKNGIIGPWGGLYEAPEAMHNSDGRPYRGTKFEPKAGEVETTADHPANVEE